MVRKGAHIFLNVGWTSSKVGHIICFYTTRYFFPLKYLYPNYKKMELQRVYKDKPHFLTF